MDMQEDSRSLWQLLLAVTESDGNCQINCTECLALLEYDADMLTAGAEVDALEKSIRQHLSLCEACQKKQGIEWGQQVEKILHHNRLDK